MRVENAKEEKKKLKSPENAKKKVLKTYENQRIFGISKIKNLKNLKNLNHSCFIKRWLCTWEFRLYLFLNVYIHRLTETSAEINCKDKKT